jgi:hypothetical protein
VLSCHDFFSCSFCLYYLGSFSCILQVYIGAPYVFNGISINYQKRRRETMMKQELFLCCSPFLYSVNLIKFNPQPHPNHHICLWSFTIVRNPLKNKNKKRRRRSSQCRFNDAYKRCLELTEAISILLSRATLV